MDGYTIFKVKNVRGANLDFLFFLLTVMAHKDELQYVDCVTLTLKLLLKKFTAHSFTFM